MARIDYDNPRSSIASATVITDADVYDGLATYHSVANVFANQTVKAFLATRSYDITRDTAISIDSFGNYRQELSTALLGLFGFRTRHPLRTRLLGRPKVAAEGRYGPVIIS